jgi:hypothetical protein
VVKITVPSFFGFTPGIGTAGAGLSAINLKSGWWMEIVEGQHLGENPAVTELPARKTWSVTR